MSEAYDDEFGQNRRVEEEEEGTNTNACFPKTVSLANVVGDETTTVL